MGTNNVQDVVNYCKDNNRVCPMPQKWNELWEMLPAKKQTGAGWEPAAPLILAAWHDTPALSKMLRLEAHIRWADKYGALKDVARYLSELDEEDWFHIGD
jgi:hypothetical protein